MKERRKAIKQKILFSINNETLGRIVRHDIERFGSLVSAIFNPGFWLAFCYRISHWCYVNKLDVVGRIIQFIAFIFTSSDISRKAFIGPGVAFFHPMGIFIAPHTFIGEKATIGPNTFIGHNRNAFDPDDSPVIDDRLTLGAGGQIYGGVLIGSKVRVAPGAIIYKNIPDDVNVIPSSSRILGKKMWQKS